MDKTYPTAFYFATMSTQSLIRELIFECCKYAHMSDIHQFKLSNIYGLVSFIKKSYRVSFYIQLGMEKYIFFMLTLLRRASFWPPSMVYISVIITHILQITIFLMWLHDSSLIEGTPWLSTSPVSSHYDGIQIWIN